MQHDEPYCVNDFDACPVQSVTVSFVREGVQLLDALKESHAIQRREPNAG